MQKQLTSVISLEMKISEYNYSGVYCTILWLCIAGAYAQASSKEISRDNGGGPITRDTCGKYAAQATKGSQREIPLI